MAYWCCKAEFGSHSEDCPDFGKTVLLTQYASAIEEVKRLTKLESSTETALSESIRYQDTFAAHLEATKKELTAATAKVEELTAFVKFLQESTKQQILDELKDENARLKVMLKEMMDA